MVLVGEKKRKRKKGVVYQGSSKGHLIYQTWSISRENQGGYSILQVKIVMEFDFKVNGQVLGFWQGGLSLNFFLNIFYCGEKDLLIRMMFVGDFV